MFKFRKQTKNQSPYSSAFDRRRHISDNNDDDPFNSGRRRSGYYDLDLDDYDRKSPQMVDVDDEWRQQHIRPNRHENNEDDRPLLDHHFEPGNDEEDERMADGGFANGQIRVAELRVRLPTGGVDKGGPWVRVEKCHFQPANRTLDTRLTFPDLTISGRVQIQPSRYGSRTKGRDEAGPFAKDNDGGSCSMILRLRQAGIEFRTVPLVEDRSRTASVRTDSYFADPGFISVFAHGCDGLMAAAAGVYGRPNSKRDRYSMDPPNQREQRSSKSTKVRDTLKFDGDILGYAVGDWGDWLEAAPQDRSWSSSSTDGTRRRPGTWQHLELANSAERDEQYTRDLEDLFSKGVRGLLTTYMQRALQPAIKETLMESLGYRLSYG